ncbi:MAG: hypothetical protein A3D28_05275 [Omnitrophica bacterium RIFCSPHIGHO2_02_FULL_63_14]|nr:MAG: hypothetical protein A3D28_05275 [Omnitrophica bacterium RIFCSPHIGHO2_02_FULL_63_14]
MKLPALNAKQRLILYVAVAVLDLFLVEHFFLAGIRAKTKSTKQQIRVEENALKIGLRVQARKDQIAGEIAKYKSYLETASLRSERDAVPMFLKEIEQIAASAGLSISNLSPQSQPEKLKDYTRYSADLRAEASSRQIFDFLYKITCSKLPIEAGRIALTPKDEQAETLRLESTLSIIIPSTQNPT